MPPDAAARGRGAATVVALTTARRATRSAVLWGALFGWLVFDEARRYYDDFPTDASREDFARSLGTNTALTAVIGPARRLETLGGYVAWRLFGLLIIVGAIWGLLLATRLMRGEEDAGRWELLLAGRTTRRHATGQALAGLAAGLAVLWTLTAGFTLAAGLDPDVDLSVSSSLFYATAATASAAMFLAVGALTSQLGPTRRQATGLAAAVFGVSYLVRMVADSGLGLAWMRWASPLGWVENLRPLTGSQPLALLPVVLAVVAAGGAAMVLAGRRDVGAGLLARPEAARANLRLLGGPAALVVRLERWVALAWIAGLALLALIFGVVAESAAEADIGVEEIEEVVGRLGGRGGGALAWIGYEFLFIAALVAFAAAGQVSALRGEEADGHLDHLLARPVSRARWLAGRVGFGAGVVALIGLATGVGGWMGLASRRSDIGFVEMLQAGVNVAAPALLILGVGTLLYGLAPRLAAPLLYVLVLWSFLVQVVGSSITDNHWVLDTAVLSHVGPVPATSLEWTAVAWLTGLGLAATLAGLAAFQRRDLASA